MCGIVGYAGFSASGLLGRMCDAIAHRGPDGDGHVEHASIGMAIGMRRLAIIDLVTGDQPFHSAEGEVDLVFNGEIYNFRSLRAELEELGRRFQTHSDTEVILEAYLAFGLDMLDRLHGMFAFAVIDRRGPRPKLVVARDRTGIKPLYYVTSAGKLAFGSEIKALLCWPDWARDIDAGAIRDYLALRYVPGPGSLFRKVRKLPAGHVMTFEAGELVVRRWWTPPKPQPDDAMGEADAAQAIGTALRASVGRHLVSDVSVGAFLSGGIDSSLLVALMAEQTSEPVQTFSIGFPDFDNADLEGAALTARRYGTRHHAIECRPPTAEMLSDIAWSLDEPVGDAIVVPMYVLAREARREVKVVLSGEGADEILGGYAFHRRLVQLAALRRLVPAPLWSAAAAMIRLAPVGALDRLVDYPGALGTEGREKIADLVASVGKCGLPELYRDSVSLFDRRHLRALSASDALTRETARVAGPALDSIMSTGSPLQRLVLGQFPDWLPDDILMKADKMSMAHGLEARVPFMDAAVIEAAARIPDRWKLTHGGNKYALRAFARNLLPAEIVAGPKRAFYFPMESFVHAPGLQETFRRTLDPARLRARGLFRPEAVAALASSPDHRGFLALKRLFAIAMLELWFERFAPDASWSRN